MQPLKISTRDKRLGKFDSIVKIDGQRVYHFDVIDFDIVGYWGKNYTPRPGENISPVRCYGHYTEIDKNIKLRSYPGQHRDVGDILTKERAKFCTVVGNLFEDFDLVEELREAERLHLSPVAAPEQETDL